MEMDLGVSRADVAARGIHIAVRDGVNRALESMDAIEKDPLAVVEVDSLTTDLILTSIAVTDKRPINLTPRVLAALAHAITDQASLDIAGARLKANKVLQSESKRLFNWTEIKRTIDKSKALILRQEHDVLDPLEQEAKIYTTKTSQFLQQIEQEKAERARQEEHRRRQEQAALEAKEREDRLAEETRINEENARLHGLEVEALLESMPADAPREDVQIICDSPAPAPVVLQPEPVVMPAYVAPPPAVVLPAGMSATPKYKGELKDLKLFCQGVIDGKVPAAWIEIDATAVAKYANAVKPEGWHIPGMDIVRDFTISQRRK